MNITPRIRNLAAIGILSGGLGIAAISGVFAAPAPLVHDANTPVAGQSSTTTTSTTGQPPSRPFFRGPGFGLGGGMLNNIATFLGMSQSDLRTALQSGQTLAQIAQAHGKTSDDLKNYLMSQVSQQIDKLLTTNFQQIQAQRPAGGPFGRQLSGVATFLGMNQSDLLTALRNGQTLAQVAQAHGKTAADLKTYLTNQLKTRLDQQVAANKITSTQETTILNNASSRFDTLINQKFPANFGQGGPGRGRFGRQPGSPTPTSTPASS
ncbi:MAG TPA: hypothetical protein VKX96_00440 [Chloroflexota bacterium]|nr:hypothetical protein [Chloroflexota bacterium]